MSNMSPTSKMGDKDRKLIEAVQPHRCLYDQAHKDRKNKMKISQIWASIARQVENSGKDAIQRTRKRWLQLHATYVRKKRDNVRTWEYYNLMTFLDPFLPSKSRKMSNMSPTSKMGDKDRKLIEAVQPHRCLYDIAHKDRKNKMMISQIWSSIARQVENTGKDAIQRTRKRWLQLHATYVRKKNLMSFLDPFLPSKSRKMSNMSPTSKMGDKDRRLIEAVQPHRCLYDQGLKDRDNKMMISQIWSYIAKQVENTGKDAIQRTRKRWLQLHATYVRKKRDNVRTWEYYNLMTFLDPSLPSKSSTENLEEGMGSDDDEKICGVHVHVDKQDLIEAVEYHRTLYDPHEPDFGDTESYTVAWESVADECNERGLCTAYFTGLEASWIWQLLRDEYVRRKKKEFDPLWKYSKELMFLDPFLQLKPRSTALYTGYGYNMRRYFDDEEDSATEGFFRSKSKLIRAVKTHPSLYNPEDPQFGYRENAEKAWKSVANQLDGYAESYMLKNWEWQLLRNAYVRMKIDGNDRKWVVKWMSFLDPVLASQSRAEPGRTFRVEDDESRTNPSTAHDVNLTAETDNMAKRPLEHLEEELSSSTPEEDFFQNCANRSKVLPKDVRGHLRLQISQLLLKAENQPLTHDHERSLESAIVLQTATSNADAPQITTFSPYFSRTATLNADASQTPSSYPNPAEEIPSQTATVTQTSYSAYAFLPQHLFSTLANSLPPPQTD